MQQSAPRDNFYSLPDNLPIPIDDGACNHLTGLKLPSLELKATDNRIINIAECAQQPTVFFFYPRTGQPQEPTPVGWDEIPGARGCTPQSCGYKNLYNDFKKLGIQIYGVSVQDTPFQQEFVARLEMPFSILSDSDLKLTQAMNLPTFTYENMILLKRMAWYCNNGIIEKIFYPVFPPDKCAENVLRWIKKL